MKDKKGHCRLCGHRDKDLYTRCSTCQLPEPLRSARMERILKYQRRAELGLPLFDEIRLQPSSWLELLSAPNQGA